jgi:hypothetical protein
MLLNSYNLYKENIPAGSKPMSCLDFNIKLLNLWVRNGLGGRKKNVPTAGSSDSRENKGKHLRKLPPGKQKDCCVCNKRKLGKGERRRSSPICAKCEKGLHGECFPEHICTAGT